jgi:hypothetical protein
MEIVATFQRLLKTGDRTEIENLSLEELRLANQKLGWRDENADFRLALQDRIKELEGEAAHAREGHGRALNWIITLCIGLIVGLVIYYVTKSPN